MEFVPEIQEKIELWLRPAYASPEQEELEALLKNGEKEALEDAFYTDIKFGTGGMRGILGAGSNRINKFTIGKACQGFVRFLVKKYDGKELKLAISHDNRRRSRELAELSADIFSGNGIEVYLFEDMRPTPELSFAVRDLKCHGGIMITASHNPSNYNGFKVYGADGGQVTAPDDSAIINEVNSITGVTAIQWEGDSQKIHILSKKMDEKFIAAIRKNIYSPDCIKAQSNIPIVYSPIHGTGSKIMKNALQTCGFNNVHLVEEQMSADSEFSTVESPNPEEKGAMEMALNKAEETKAELVMATDPDADRVGIAIPDPQGKYQLINGNQMAALLTYYLLNMAPLESDPYVVSTIVSTPLLGKMCAKHGVNYYETLTGFKHIGKLMTKYEGEKKFIGGGEESYGYLPGDHVRDKDAIATACLLAEICAYYRNRGASMYEAMVEMSIVHGLYRERLYALKKEGKRGKEEIAGMLSNLRNNPPQQLAGEEVRLFRDLQAGTELNLKNGESSRIDLPNSNVLQFITSRGTVLSARPSGTEPKIKFYVSVNTNIDSADQYLESCSELDGKIDAILEEFAPR